MYAYADGGGEQPNIIKLARLIDRYGARAVLNRGYIGYGEMLQINTAERIMSLYNEMQQFEDWSLWARQNKEGAAYLTRVMKKAHEAGLIDE